MVEPSFLAFVALIFVIILVFILRNSGSTKPKHHNNNNANKREQKRIKPTEKKNKGQPKTTSWKKPKRLVEVKEWVGVDTVAKDAQEMLDFLKGGDPQELAKQHNQSIKPIKPNKPNNNKKKSKKAKNEEVSSEESANDTEGSSNDGFYVISKKPIKERVERKKKSEPVKKEPIAFFKFELTEEEKERKAKKKARKEGGGEKRKSDGEKREKSDGEKREKSDGEQREKSDGEKRERRERPEGEKRERRERPEGEKRERRERPEGEKPIRRPISEPPQFGKYEEAKLEDILDRFTEDYKAKTKRKDTLFSHVPRKIMVNILGKLEAHDLVALSTVNHYFNAIAKKDSLWKKLMLRDFGLRDEGKYRNFKLAYKGEYKKRKKLAAAKNAPPKPTPTEPATEKVEEEEPKDVEKEVPKEAKEVPKEAKKEVPKEAKKEVPKEAKKEVSKEVKTKETKTKEGKTKEGKTKEEKTKNKTEEAEPAKEEETPAE